MRPGENELKVEIVNMWVNRLTGDMLSEPENRYCRTNHPYMTSSLGGDEPYREQTSGLLGPVEIKVESTKGGRCEGAKGGFNVK